MKLKQKPLHLQKHWDYLIIASITLILLLTIFIPFIFINSLDKFDTPGLLSLSWFIKEYKFPDFQGWNPYFFAGFPQGILYPPLFHWTVAALGKIISLEPAYKLIITIAGLFIPITVYRFNKKLYDRRGFALLSTLIILIGLILLPGYLGFNFDGLLDYGLGPSFVSIPLFFGFLSNLFSNNISSKKLAILFSILLLTHLLTAAIAALVALGYLLHVNKKSRKKLIISGVLIFLLTAFWTIPFLIFKGYSASGFAMKISILFPIGVLSLSLFELIIIIATKESSQKGRLLSLLKVSFLVSFVCLIDLLINTNTTRFSIPLIHPFRIQVYGIILSLTCLTYAIQKSHATFIKIATKLKLQKFFERKVHISLNISLLVIIIIILTYIRLNPFGVEKIFFDDEIKWDGRIMRSYKVSEVLDQSRAVIDRAIMQNPGNLAVDGLLKESSFLAPYYQSLAKNLNPENYNWDELDQYYIENQKVPEDKVEYIANLLWVKSLFTIDSDFPNCTDFNQISSFTTNSKEDGIVERDMYICMYEPSTNSNLTQIIDHQPSTKINNWKKELESWWVSDEKELFTDREVTSDFTYDTGTDLKNVIIEFSSNYQEMNLTNPNNEVVNTLVKISYFPKWKAYDSNGNKIEIYRISPSFMLVPVENEVTIRFERTTVEWITLCISLFTLLIVLVLIIRKCLSCYQKDS